MIWLRARNPSHTIKSDKVA